LKGIRDQAGGGAAEGLESVENEKTILPIMPPATNEVIECLNHNNFYVLLPYITYVMQSGRFSQCPAFLSRMAKERDKKYSVKSPQRYKK
jgi:hypothetical protein